MQSYIDNYDRPTSAYVRRRLAEAILSQDQYDGSAWVQLDPGPSAVASLSTRAQSLHHGLLGNALRHIDQYMDQETHALAVGESLQAQIDPEGHWYSQSLAPALPENTDYMERVSAFRMGQEPVMESIAGVQADNQTVGTSTTDSPRRKAAITYYGDGNTLRTLHDVDLEAVTKRCPLLAIAFEESRSGPQLFLETLSTRTAEPFLRFLHTGSYAEASEEWNSFGRYEDVPTSVLLHCEMFRLGDIYDLSEMKSQAYVNVLRQCEFGCSSPDKLIDLCMAIRFVYTHLDKQEQLIDAFINYCVACFLRHQLAEDVEFKQLAYDLRPFHQDLCKNCMNRGFENETAAAIIQMPFEPHRPDTYASTEHRHSFDDVVFHLHANDEVDTPKKRKRADMEIALPVRSVQEATMSMKKEAQSDDFPVKFAEHKRRSSARVIPDGPSRGIKVEEEFEKIDLGPSPEKAVDSGSDSFEWVDVMPARPKTSEADTISIRPRETAKAERSAADESDSDWSLV